MPQTEGQEASGKILEIGRASSQEVRAAGVEEELKHAP